MDEESNSRRRSFLALVEVERDDAVEGGGWVTLDSLAEDGVHTNYGDSVELLMLRAPLDKAASVLPALPELDGGWARIEVSQSAVDAASLPAQVVMFGNSDGNPSVWIVSAEGLPRDEQKELDSGMALAREPQAYAGFISGVLDIPFNDSHRRAVAVSVYDVGQGNCNAVVDGNEHPLVFYDLGWAPNFHAASRPQSMPKLFSCDPRGAIAPVVLSHWDMDHWCYAIAASRYVPGSLTTRHEWRPEALARFWIARAPQANEGRIGPLAWAFYQALRRTEVLPGLSAILLWPQGAKRIPFSIGWLEACRPAEGTAVDRNNSGIAMFVRPYQQDGAILLTGDADFTSIPGTSGKKKIPLAGLVAPHHGARISTSAIPKPKRGGPARLVMSVGLGNSYGHPKKEAIDGYAKKGWTSSMTQSRSGCDRAHHHNHDHGNTLLMFRSDGYRPRCSCKCVADGSLCLLPHSTAFVAPQAGIRKRSKRQSPVTAPA